MLFGDVTDVVAKSRVIKLYSGNIDGNRYGSQALVQTGLLHGTYFVPYIAVQYTDKTVLFKQRNEGTRRNHTFHRVLPAN